MTACLLVPLDYQPDPSARFERLQEAADAVLLDSGRPQATRGRFDLMSAWPRVLFEPSPGETGLAFLARLREGLRQLGQATLPDHPELPFAGGLIGLLSYDFGRRLERLPEQALDDLPLPHARVGLYAWALVSDHVEQSTYLVFHPSMTEAERQRIVALFTTDAGHSDSQSPTFRLTQPFRSDTTRAHYGLALDRIQRYIQAGDCYQVNFAQRFHARYEGAPLTAYRRLRAACPTPFAAYLAIPGGAVLSLSPERFLRVSGKAVETRPIKGTRPRAPEAEQDQAYARELLDSPKDRAENLMIVDLLRNDLGRACRIGSVRVPELFALESYPNVHHLVSAVTGTLADGCDPLDLLAASFPGGSITGAPKIRAMQIIDELEPSRRSIYCGSLFYLDVRGEMDSSIAIRTLLASEGQLFCWGGGGIVADSDVDGEYQESLTKVRVLLEALED